MSERYGPTVRPPEDVRFVEDEARDERKPHMKPEMGGWAGLSGMLEEDRQPVIGVGDKRMCVVSAGDAALHDAAAFLELPEKDVTLLPFSGPSSPLWRFMLGQASSPNHERMLEGARAIYAWYFDRADWPAAKQALLEQLAHEAKVGLWSTPRGKGEHPTSEAFGPSHASHNLTADMEWRVLAEVSEDADLLKATEAHCLMLAAYLRDAADKQGRVMLVGPRAWQGLDKKGRPLPNRSGQSFQANGVRAALLGGRIGKTEGYDNLPVRLAKRIKLPELPADAPLPVTVDPIRIRRRGDDVLVWAEAIGPNGHLKPGPQWVARSLAGALTFAVDPRVGPDPGKGFLSSEQFNPDEWLPPGPDVVDLRTRSTGTAPLPVPPPEPPAPQPGPARRTPEQVAVALRAKLREMEALVAEVEGLG